MEIPKIHEGEYRFCLIMWEHEPISAAQLVKLCQEQLGWKRTTTYTVIKRLGERGVLKNDVYLYVVWMNPNGFTANAKPQTDAFLKKDGLNHRPFLKNPCNMYQKRVLLLLL